MSDFKTIHNKRWKVDVLYQRYTKKVSLGWGEQILTGQLTKGQKNLYYSFFDAIKTTKPIIDDFKEIETHTEPKSRLFMESTLYITDTANIAGHNVGSDGIYFHYANRLYSFDDLRKSLNA